MNHAQATVLICEDDPMCQRSLALVLGRGFRLEFTPDGERLLEMARRLLPDVVLLDIALRTEREGFSILPKLKALSPTLPILIHSGSSDYESVVQAMRLGAADFIPKDTSPDKVRSQVEQAVAQRRRREAARANGSTEAETCEFVGQSPCAQSLRGLVTRIRTFTGNVIITGESGVGKEVVARMLRRTRADGTPEPFVAVDSSTIQGSTAESTLFGHERGAFTGADKARAGLFEQAHGGTIYFDEIANMPLDIQAKLLRAIQEQEIVRLGATKPIKLRFRAICASNRDLEALSRDGEFRFDLYARLSVFPIRVPPLRERREDIPRLLEYFLARYAEGPLPHIAAEALEQLTSYDWPGNVRELANMAQYLLAMARDNRIEKRDLPGKFKMRDGALVPDARTMTDVGFHNQIKAFEEAMLRREYSAANGNISLMARRLELDRSSLYRKLREHNIHTQERINNELASI